MTSEQFNKQSCEIIEKIQDYQIKIHLLEYALNWLREDYIREQTEIFKANVDQLNKKMAGRSR